MSKRLSVFAAAKINLYLKVGEKQIDDYHQIETIYQTIDLFDRLTFELLDKNNEEIPSGASRKSLEFKLTIVNSLQKDLIPTDKTNLIYKATRLIMDKLKISHLNLEVELEKKIPVAGGLAGGSSNAAATLFALNYLLGEPLSQSDLLNLAKELGSDIPFVLLGGCMLGTGRGDQLIRLPEPKDLLFLIVFPPADLQLKAKDIYETFDQIQEANSIPKPEISIEKFIEVLLSRKSDISKYLFNSLEESAISLSFWVDKVKSLIDAKGYKSLVSGSGPTVFTIVPNQNQGLNLLHELNKQGFTAQLHQTTSEAFQVIIH